MHQPINAPRSLDSRTRQFLFLAFTVFFLLSFGQPPAQAALEEARIVEVNDGDTVTILMNGQTYRTRLIGIDAPELGQRPWGRKAKEHLIQILNETGWTVNVETGVVKRDKYDRLLAYLWTKNHELINERMATDGFAVLFTIAPNDKYADRFSRAVDDAALDKKGIWGPNGLNENPSEYRKEHPRTELRTAAVQSDIRYPSHFSEADRHVRTHRDSGIVIPGIAESKEQNEFSFTTSPDIRYGLTFYKKEHVAHRTKRAEAKPRIESKNHSSGHKSHKVSKCKGG